MRRITQIAGIWLVSGWLGTSLLAQTTTPGNYAPQTTAAAPADSQPQLVHHVITPLTVAAYDYLLDVLFPVDHTLSPMLDYTLVLRFEPRLHPESQIVIRHFHQGKIEATVSQVANGSAWSAAYQQLIPGESPNFQAIAANIQLRDRKFNVDPQQLETWHKEIFPVLAKEGARVRNTDKEIHRRGNQESASAGTRYELWFIQMNDEEHMVAWGSEAEDMQTGSSTLTQWMNKVRLYAQSQVHSTTGPTRPGIANALPMSVGLPPVETPPPATEAVMPVAAVQPVATAQPAVSTIDHPVYPQPGHPETMPAVAVTPGPAYSPTTATAFASQAAAPVMNGTTQAASGTTVHPIVFPQPGHPETYSTPAPK